MIFVVTYRVTPPDRLTLNHHSNERRVYRVVEIDNLSAHKGERVRELIEGRGCQLLYLPAYSPDFMKTESLLSGSLLEAGYRA
jgi:transposase